jgi:hypothetical protein
MHESDRREFHVVSSGSIKMYAYRERGETPQYATFS